MGRDGIFANRISPAGALLDATADEMEIMVEKPGCDGVHGDFR